MDETEFFETTKRLERIKVSTKLPSYSDLMICLNLAINESSNSYQRQLLKYIFERAEIQCPKPYVESPHDRMDKLKNLSTKMKTMGFQKILDGKREHYGDTPFAILVSAQQYARACVYLTDQQIHDQMSKEKVNGKSVSHPEMKGATWMRDSILKNIQ